MSRQWRGHAATPTQQSLCFEPETKKPASKRKGHTHAEVLLGTHRAVRAAGSPLELPAIMQAGIAQHGARPTELREQGFEIANEMERSVGVVRSCHGLVLDPAREIR